MKVWIYEQLLGVCAGYDQVQRALASLGRSSRFHRAELARFRDLAEESRAATISYLSAIIEIAETEQAGRCFGKRIAQEKREEQRG